MTLIINYCFEGYLWQHEVEVDREMFESMEYNEKESFLDEMSELYYDIALEDFIDTKKMQDDPFNYYGVVR